MERLDVNSPGREQLKIHSVGADHDRGRHSSRCLRDARQAPRGRRNVGRKPPALASAKHIRGSGSSCSLRVRLLVENGLGDVDGADDGDREHQRRRDGCSESKVAAGIGVGENPWPAAERRQRPSREPGKRPGKQRAQQCGRNHQDHRCHGCIRLPLLARSDHDDDDPADEHGNAHDGPEP